MQDRRPRYMDQGGLVRSTSVTVKMEQCRKEGHWKSRQDPNLGRVSGADTCGLPSTPIALLPSSASRVSSIRALAAVAFRVPFGTLSQPAQLLISLAASPWRRLSPQLLGAVSFKSLNCCPYLSTLASFICRVFFFFLIFPRCHFGHNGCLWNLSE